MTMRRDTRGGDLARPRQTGQDDLSPGKRTLVESVFAGHVAAEVAKGGADAKARGPSAPPAAAPVEAEHGQDANQFDIDQAHPAATSGGHGQAKPAQTGESTEHTPAAGTSAQAKPAAAAHVTAPATGAVAKQERVVPRIDLGGSGISSATSSTHALDTTNETKQQRVAATGAPTFNAAAGSNDCTPGTVSGASVTWAVVEGPTTWGVNVTGFTTTGVINVALWPSKPNEMVTPNTANPVDGGNITDAPGNNNWKFAIKEMEEYNQPGGGRSTYWHSYEASKAHEWAHWNTDWMVTCIGALWPVANADLDAITIPKASAATAAAAKALLQAKIDARMATLDATLTSRWIPIPDTPGVAGSTGYIAGQAVLNPLISAVKAYAAKKGWT